MKNRIAIIIATLAAIAAGGAMSGSAFAATQGSQTSSTVATTTSVDMTTSTDATTTATGSATSSTISLADDCSLTTADIEALQAIQNDPTLTPSEELNEELALRKTLLATTISCAVKDTNVLEQTLNAATPANQAGAAIQSTLSGKLNDAINFYDLESSKLATVGISGTKAVAQELLSWREANELPLEGQVNNFILWNENQALFQTAQSRLAQTQYVVSFIESAAPSGDLQNALSAVIQPLQNAEDDNTQAGTALAQFLPADQSLALIQESLQSLATAYQKFSDLNTLIQQLLPTGQ